MDWLCWLDRLAVILTAPVPPPHARIVTPIRRSAVLRRHAQTKASCGAGGAMVGAQPTISSPSEPDSLVPRVSQGDTHNKSFMWSGWSDGGGPACDLLPDPDHLQNPIRSFPRVS